MASRQQNRQSRSNGRVGVDCPHIHEAVVLWDDPWPRRQLLTAKKIAQQRKYKGTRGQHDAPWWVRFKTSMRYLTPIFLFGCLIVAGIAFNRWAKQQESALGGAMDALGGKGDDTVYDGVVPEGELSPTPPPIPTDIPLLPTPTVFIMPSTGDDNAMAPPYESVRETLTATALYEP
jgi:hypothetical protein